MKRNIVTLILIIFVGNVFAADLSNINVELVESYNDPFLENAIMEIEVLQDEVKKNDFSFVDILWRTLSITGGIAIARLGYGMYEIGSIKASHGVDLSGLKSFGTFCMAAGGAAVAFPLVSLAF